MKKLESFEEFQARTSSDDTFHAAGNAEEYLEQVTKWLQVAAEWVCLSVRVRHGFVHPSEARADKMLLLAAVVANNDLIRLGRKQAVHGDTAVGK